MEILGACLVKVGHWDRQKGTRFSLCNKAKWKKCPLFQKTIFVKSNTFAFNKWNGNAFFELDVVLNMCIYHYRYFTFSLWFWIPKNTTIMKIPYFKVLTWDPVRHWLAHEISSSTNQYKQLTPECKTMPTANSTIPTCSAHWLPAFSRRTLPTRAASRWIHSPMAWCIWWKTIRNKARIIHKQINQALRRLQDGLITQSYSFTRFHFPAPILVL